MHIYFLLIVYILRNENQWYRCGSLQKYRGTGLGKYIKKCPLSPRYSYIFDVCRACLNEKKWNPIGDKQVINSKTTISPDWIFATQ